MRRADAGLFNLTPFRGPSADAGTVFELGFLSALGKPLYGYSNSSELYVDRVAALQGPLRHHEGYSWDSDGYSVEPFGLPDNLMIIHAIKRSGGVVTAVEDDPKDKSLAALPAFKACLKELRARMANTAASAASD